jgi:hypothetical protein
MKHPVRRFSPGAGPAIAENRSLPVKDPGLQISPFFLDMI